MFSQAHLVQNNCMCSPHRRAISVIQLYYLITPGDTMKLTLLSFLCLSFLFCSCFSVGSASLPSASEGFIPKKSYEKSYEEIWNASQNVLLAERVNIISQDKENKRIQTDYIQGATQVALLGGALSTRYKYNIVFTPNGTTTGINIVATLESSSKSIDWHDISKDNSEKVSSIENYLYEKIEQSIK
jgi:hypothetical protein